MSWSRTPQHDESMSRESKIIENQGFDPSFRPEGNYVSSLHLRRSGGVEKVPAGGRLSSLNPDHLKSMRKRKRKEYLSPSEEESDIDGTVEQHCYFFSISADISIDISNILMSEEFSYISMIVAFPAF